MVGLHLTDMGYSSEKHSVSSCCWMAVCVCVCVCMHDFGKSREVSGIYMITEPGPEPDQSRADASAVSVRETAPCNLVASKKVDIKCCISGYFSPNPPFGDIVCAEQCCPEPSHPSGRVTPLTYCSPTSSPEVISNP